MNRRHFLAALPALPAALSMSLLPSLARATGGKSAPALIAAWRSSVRLSPAGEILGNGNAQDYVGLLMPEWSNTDNPGRIVIRRAVPVPSRVHGLVADTREPGGFFAMAYRPGSWLQRIDADGRIAARADLVAEGSGRTLDGHAALTPDGRWLVTGETRTVDGSGWIGIRDRDTLARVAEWPTHGIEPHDLRIAADGRLFVAHGGILRAPGDRKRDLDRMDSSLARLDIASGKLLGQWRMPDPRLSLRHLAIARDAAGHERVGVAMQAEYDDPATRKAAPIFAVLDGEALRIPSHMPVGAGFCSDISPGPNGGFYLNGERVNRVFRWSPEQPGELVTIAELERAGALAAWQQPGGTPDTPGVIIGAARGMARWHPQAAVDMLRWPIELALDNHWVAV